MSILKKLYNKSKEEKGFTLVELIVVLVIIAILAAILVPSLLKYIDTAKEKQATIDARTAYLGVQTALAEQYAVEADKIPTTKQAIIKDDDNVPKLDSTINAANNTTAEKALPYVEGIQKKFKCEFTVTKQGKITDFKYIPTEGTKQIVVTSGGAMEVVKK